MKEMVLDMMEIQTMSLVFRFYFYFSLQLIFLLSLEEEEETVELRRGSSNKRKRSVLFPKMSDKGHWKKKSMLDEAREIDAFNLSNDAWYIRSESSSLWNSVTDIAHSLPGEKYMALKNLPEKSELQNFHRPRHDLYSASKHKIKLAKQNERMNETIR